MNVRKFSLIGGIVMLVAGLAALLPGFMQYPDSGLPALQLDSGYGLFLGFLPMNILNKLALIAFGLWGISASRAPATSLPKSIAWSRTVFAVFGTLSLLGMFASTKTLFGYMPLFHHYIWVHGLASILGAYYGYSLSSRVPAQGDDPNRYQSHVAGT